MSRGKALVTVRRKVVPAPPPTITPMHLLVTELLADLAAMQAKIPRFQHPHPKTQKVVRTYRSVPREFVKQINDSVRDSDELRAFKTYDVEEGLEAVDFADNFRKFRDALDIFTRGLNFTIEYRHAEVAAKGLQTYQIAKALRTRPRSDLRSHVARMRDALNRAGKKRRKKKEEEK
jgi:hypothetical protein